MRDVLRDVSLKNILPNFFTRVEQLIASTKKESLYLNFAFVFCLMSFYFHYTHFTSNHTHTYTHTIPQFTPTKDDIYFVSHEEDK